MDNKEIAKELRCIKNNNSIRLSSLIVYKLVNDVLTLIIEHPCENMQTNQNAFEGWAVVLKSAFGNRIKKVILDVNRSNIIKPDNAHYSRFLWRAYNFSNIFDWFEIGNCKNDVDNFVSLKLKNVYLNIPSGDRNPVENSTGERFVEYLFVDNKRPYYDQLRKLIGSDEILNQIPVGLFQNNITNDNRIFTAGASAIDLVGFKYSNTLQVIELKISDNNKLGVISEILFYSFIMHNLFISNNFKYSQDIQIPNSFSNYFKTYNKGSINKIDSYLLCEGYHPLLDSSAIDLLNSGLSNFSIKLRKLKYKYHNDINNPEIRNLEII